MGKQYVLAMYDVRGKQDYIFRGNKIKEIVGASLIIRDIYKDYLLSAKYNNNIVDDSDTDFSWDKFVKHMEVENKNGEVVYDGGGNFLVLFRDEATFQKITQKFTLTVLRETVSLRIIGTCIEVDGCDFEKDREALYKKHRITENTIQNVPCYASLPISLVHPNSSLPIVYRGTDYTKEPIELTAEQLAKYKKYKNCVGFGKDKEEFAERILDRIAPEKGTDSYIAVIYIDGNSMGVKVQECTRNRKTYDECINALRRFSKSIQEECIDSKKKVIDEKLAELYPDTDIKRRLILGAGDEINMIVAGRDAFEVAKAYLEALDKEKGYSSCAGIALFKSHMPYADAYRIAEECCESGKEKMKQLNLQNTSFLDFHLCQGSIDVSLEQIRMDEETEEPSRPWLIVDANKECTNKEKIFGIEEIENVISFLQKIGHGNTKGLLTASRAGARELRMELKRIKAHQSNDKRKEMNAAWKEIDKMNDSRLCKMVYDVVLMYDLWFKRGEA